MTAAALMATLVAAPGFAVITRTISLSMPASTTTGATITVRGTLTHSAVGSLVIISRKSGRSWIQVAAARTKTSAGAYVHSFRVPTSRGTYYYDAFAPKTAQAEAAVSTTRSVVVRTPVSVTLTVSNAFPVDGSDVTLTGAVTPWISGTPVSLQHRIASATTWSTVAALYPNSGGKFTATTVPAPDQSNYYRVVVSQHGYYTRAISRTVSVAPHTSAPPPSPVAGFSATPHTPGVGVDLAWNTIPGTDPNNPSDISNNQTLVIRRASGNVAPGTPTSGSAVATLSATQTNFTDTSGLTPGAAYSYSIFLENLSGQFSSASTASVLAPDPPPGIIWGPITNPVPFAGTARFLQCPTPSFCMLLGGLAYQTWNGASWTKPQSLPYQLDVLKQLSCASATLCMIVDGHSYLVFNGQTWSSPVSLASSLLADDSFGSVACPTSSFCLTTTYKGGSLKWDGSSWSVATDSTPSIPGPSGSIHCASIDLCWAQSGAQWDGTTWTASQQWDTVNGSDQMSCPTTSFCIGVNEYGPMFEYRNGQWNQMISPWPTGEQVSAADVACTSASFCISVAQSFGSGFSTSVSTFDGTSWSTPVTLHPQVATDPLVACPSASRCLEVDTSDDHADEELAWFQNGVWTAPTLITQANHMAGVSCIPNGACTSVDYAGNIRTYDGTAWSSPTLVDDASGVMNISCGTTTFCAVVDDGGGAVVENNGVWGVRQVLTPGEWLTYLSCTSDEACMAMTDTGIAEQYKAGHWTNVTSTSFNFAGPVACGSMNYCVSVGYWWNGSSWLEMPSTNGTYYTTATCITALDCLIAFGGNAGFKPTAAHFVNGAWQGAPFPIGPPGLSQSEYSTVDSMSCVSSSLCVAIGDGLVTFSPGGVTMGPYVPIDNGVYSVSCSSSTLCIAIGGDNVLVGN